CFFFQAEDGIRDATVTGVQTCALPIFLVTRQVFAGAGKAYQTRDGIQYCLSQRGQQPVSASASSPYPVIDMRDQPLADATRYRRDRKSVVEGKEGGGGDGQRRMDRQWW